MTYRFSGADTREGRAKKLNLLVAQVEAAGPGGSGTVTSVSGAGTVSGLTLTGTVTTTGSLTLGGTLLVATAAIQDGAVTLAKQADMATASVIYRKTAGAGAPEVQTLATLKTDLGLTGTNSGDQTTITGNAGTATTLQTSRDFSITGGGITAAAVGFAGAANVVLSASVDPGHITLARMADIATSSLIYRKTAGAGAPEVQTLATLKTDLGLTGTNSGDQTITLTGNVTGSGTGSFATTIAAGAVTNAMMANSAITIAGTSTALGGSITQDTITGLASTGLIKRTAANTLAIATASTDYAPATSGTALLKGNGSGGFSAASAGTDYVAPDAQLTDLAGLAYTANGGKFVRVNAGETAFELATIAGGGDVTGDDTSTTAQNIVAYTGTGGKNITELTGTQGDILYHNGTSWAKLAAGTLGQFLNTNGSGANPSWQYGAVIFSNTTPGATTTAADTAFVSVSGHSFSYVASATYRIWIMGRVNSTAATTGCAMALNTSSAVTAINLNFHHPLTSGTTGTLTGGYSIADEVAAGATSGVPAGPLDVPITAFGLLVTGANTGTCQLLFRSEVAAVTELMANSAMVVERVA